MNETSKKLSEKLKQFSTPELCDGGAEGVMDYTIKPFVSSGRIAGPAYTVNVPENISGIVPDAFADIRPGEVLVIAGNGCCKGSYWGDYRSLCAKKLGVEAVIIDGAFRDYDECKHIGIPIFAKGIIPHSAGKDRIGELQTPVICGGVTVNPGDIIVADANGVLVIPPQEADAIMEGAQRKKDAEARTLQKMEETNVIIPRVVLS